MTDSNDIYAITGRIKNIIAKEDISLSPAGTILVNTHALMLKDLYDLAEKYDHHPHMEEMIALLKEKEKLPAYVLKLTMPKEEDIEGYRQSLDEISLFLNQTLIFLNYVSGHNTPTYEQGSRLLDELREIIKKKAAYG